jgi:hypothetical protein
VSAPVPDLVAGLAACLRGDAASLAEWSTAEILRAASWHGVTALLERRLDRRPDIPPDLQAALQRERALGGALEMLRRREIVRVLDALGTRGLRPLLVKGSALAYTLYDDPSLRPRFDTDLLVRKEEAAAAEEVMRALGYRRPAQVTGELVMYQVDYSRRDPSGLTHVFDFHWKISNRQAVADTLTFEDLDAGAQPVPALGASARGSAAVPALVLACVHRVAHHSADERLIWLYDIHLLAQGLSSSDVDAFIALSRDRSVTLICADGLLAARRAFATALPSGLLERLTPADRSPSAEPSAALLTAEPTLANELISDLKAVGWPQRVRLLREHAFPPARYMRSAYMVTNPAWLPALYTHRLVRGAWRLLRGAAR